MGRYDDAEFGFEESKRETEPELQKNLLAIEGQLDFEKEFIYKDYQREEFSSYSLFYKEFYLDMRNCMAFKNMCNEQASVFINNRSSYISKVCKVSALVDPCDHNVIYSCVFYTPAPRLSVYFCMTKKDFRGMGLSKYLLNRIGVDSHKETLVSYLGDTGRNFSSYNKKYSRGGV